MNTPRTDNLRERVQAGNCDEGDLLEAYENLELELATFKDAATLWETRYNEQTRIAAKALSHINAINFQLDRLLEPTIKEEFS